MDEMEAAVVRCILMNIEDDLSKLTRGQLEYKLMMTRTFLRALRPENPLVLTKEPGEEPTAERETGR